MLEKISYHVRFWLEAKLFRAVLIAVLCVTTAAAGIFLRHSVRTVCISDGESRYTVRSFSDNVMSVLNAANLKSNSYRIKTMNKKSLFTQVEIEYTFPVYLTIGSETVKLEATEGTVSEILAAAGIAVDEYDYIEPSADTVITETVYIDFADVDYISGSYTEEIPVSVETVYSADMPAGSVSEEAGKTGVKQVNYTRRTVNGETVETMIDSITVLSDAVSTKRIIGTKTNAVKTSSTVKAISTLSPSAAIELDENGIPVNYVGHKTVQATAYTYTGHNCSTGVAPQPGYIAVNPDVIPYGTRMYIVSSDGKYTYGYAVAADTGGFTKSKPSNVDLFFSSKSECTAFGRRNVEIYFLP